MGRIKGRKPSPATLISIVALIFAVTGTAAAGVATVSVLNKKERKQTRSIADSEVNRLAPGLSVKSANSANAATNSDNLDGHDSTEFVRKNETFTRSWSCAGSGFNPVASGQSYATNNSLREGGPAQVRCSAVLPDGATVTSVRFNVQDSDSFGSISNCQLWRTDTIGNDTLMASTPNTSGTPGNTTLSDTTIDANPIDNANFAYFLQCTLASTFTGIWAAHVEYAVPGG
jgi:hypothetical protein